MPDLWDAFKDKLKERLNWDTFKREIGQGMETMPQMGITLPGKIPASILVKNLLRERSLTNPGVYTALKGFIDPDNLKFYYSSLEPEAAHNYLAKKLGYTAENFPANVRRYFGGDVSGVFEQPSEMSAKMAGLIRATLGRGLWRTGSDYAVETVNKPKNLRAIYRILRDIVKPSTEVGIDVIDPVNTSTLLSRRVLGKDWYPGYIEDALKNWPNRNW